MKNKSQSGNKLKIALVHDYLKDAGGAERVLKVMSDMFPQAPIYTAFFDKNSDCAKIFEGVRVVESKYSSILKFKKLYSPLRFMIPLIWKSFDLSGFDLVISSSSNYIARGFRVSEKTKVVVYCHTPPRFLYGLKTGIDWKKNFFVRIYGLLAAHFLRIFDYNSAEPIKYWIANSENVKKRIRKFYKKDAFVIYPPCTSSEIEKSSKKVKKEKYFLIVSRLVGSKGILEAIKAMSLLGYPLKIVGASSGIFKVENQFKDSAAENIEFIGRVDDKKLWNIYAKARGFIALAKDEDFGITVVEAQASGTPVICYKGGGFLETVVDGKTGIFVEDTKVDTIKAAISRFNKIKWDREYIVKNSLKFDRAVFEKNLKKYLRSELKLDI